MADIAACLVDQLLSETGYRHWVLTFPWTLRFRLAVDRKLFSGYVCWQAEYTRLESLALPGMGERRWATGCARG